MTQLTRVDFTALNTDSPFFLPLMEDYPDFKDWVKKKILAGEKAYIVGQAVSPKGMIYLKDESGVIDDVTPSLECERGIKIGTFKLTGLGKKFAAEQISNIVVKARVRKCDLVYITLFEKHKALLEFLKGQGFKNHGVNSRGELVYILDPKLRERILNLHYLIDD